MGEYQERADNMDLLRRDEVDRGRMRRQLDLYGELITVMIGKYVEMSEDGQNLLDVLASSRFGHLEKTSGLASRDRETEKEIAQAELCRQLATVNLRASMSCLLDRLHQAGPGEEAKLRTRKQEWVARQEERMEAEREVEWTTRVMGQSAQEGQNHDGVGWGFGGTLGAMSRGPKL